MTRYKYPLFRPNVTLSQNLMTSLGEVFALGELTQGTMEARLEQALAGLFEAPLALTNSCTSALALALHLAGIAPNSVVLTTPQTCTATNSVIVHSGATLAWLDVDPLVGNVSGHTLDRWFEENPSRSLQDRVSALVVVDWGGRACDYDSLRAVLLRRLNRHVPVIEDAAHATLTRYKQAPISRVGGDYVCWSFQAIKHLTTGDGGALSCRDYTVLERARKLKWFGIDRRLSGPRFMHNIEEIGFKYHMNDISATIGLAQTDGLPALVDQYRANARRLWEAGMSVEGIELAPFDYDSSYWFAPLLVKTAEARESLRQWLEARGIEAGEVHRRNDHITAFHERALRAHTTFPGLDAFSTRQLNLPCGAWMSSSDLDEVATAVAAWSKTT